ncbi:hypothetical protein EDB83DRAFT_2311522 [Lactarius deliciosus]|nr:hypothetical protein EDB83DRAFT_2311522 [Lactarius deliciosus]
MSMTSCGQGSAQEVSMKKGMKLHPFYFEDPHVVLKAGGSARVEGVDDEHPICIPDTTTATEFENLLWFLYFGMHDDYRPTVTDWISILTVSTRLIFPKVRERAIKELTSRLEDIEPFDLIGLAVKYDVQQWLKPTYRRIVTRVELITYAEAQKIPFPMAVMLMRSHERYSLARLTKDGNHRSSSLIIQTEVTIMEKELPVDNKKAT